ncbi:MAG TPA: PAS domain S-box protein [Planctomycetota bacterium]|jgi:PAS domain S-box-containing protein
MSKPANVLYIAGDGTDRQHFLEMVRDRALGWNVTVAETMGAARASLSASRFDVIIAANHLPDGESKGLLGEITDTPFVLVTDAPDESDLGILERGADDFLVRDPEHHYLEALPFAVQKTLYRKAIHEKERRLSRELRDSEARLRATFHNAASGIAEIDRDGHLVAVNDFLCQMLGYTREELLGMSVHDLTYPEDRPRSDELNAQIKEGRLPMFQYEKRYLKRDGSPLWVHVAVSAVRNDAGYYLYSVGTVVDIGSRKAAEAQLRLQAAALEAAPNAVSLSKTDRQGTIVWVNRAFTELTGYSAEEAVGRSHRILSSGQHSEAFYRSLWETIHRGEVWRGEILNRRKDGSLYYEEMGITPLRDERGQITHYVAIKQDVTARKRAEEASRESAERFQTLADNIAQLAWMADKSGWTFWYNRRWYDYTGTALKDVEGWGWQNVLHPEHAQRVVEKIGQCFESGEVWEDTFPLRGQDGHYRWFLSRAVPIRNGAGNVTRWIGTSTDITEQREIQQALTEAHHRKDEFLAVLGHELRNPLAAIHTAVHLQKRAETSDPLLLRSRGIISRQTAHMARLIDDLLDVSRISRGKIQLKREYIDLTALLSDVAQDYESICESAGLKLELCLPEQPVWIFGDSARVQQIAGNLVNNAIKFTDAGGKVSLSLGAGEHKRALIMVQDSGIGIEPETMRRIFQPFHQAESSVGRSRGGLGLGLALVKGLTELHGGEIHAESRGMGHGSTFTVRLPVEAEAKPEPVKPVEPSVRAHRILLVEDNLDAAESLSLLLTYVGHEVSIAHSGMEAVKRAQEFRPDVVLCDIGLPGGMNGYDIARAIRANPELSATYLIAMTGYGQEEDRRLAQEAGFDHHITKPADPEALERLLSR